MTEHAEIRVQLEAKKAELTARLERITANLRRGYDADSKERAKEMEDSDVVDALGNEARQELAKVSAALTRFDQGEFGLCSACGSPISAQRIAAYPYAEDCIDCARDDERQKSRR